MYPVGYSTERLALRELDARDVDAVHAIYGDAKATEHLSFEPRTREEVAAIVHGCLASAKAKPRVEYALAVTLGEGGDLIGFTRLAMDPHQQRAAIVGFALHVDHWGSGLGTETVRALMGLGFGVLELHRLWAARAPLNVASHHTLLKAGMVQEGMIREHVFVRGAWRDSVTYSVLEKEWRSG